jgi:PmbA protein
MIGEDKIFSTLEKVMVASKADQTEAVFSGSSDGLTRFANSFVHQNVAIEDTRVSFRVAVDRRIGTACCNSLTVTDLRRALRAAYDIARRQKPNPHFHGFAMPAEYPVVDTLDEKTVKFTPRQRASKLKRVFSKGQKFDYDMAGSFSTDSGEVAVANSNGVRCYNSYSSASINVIATGENSSGYASGASNKIDEIEVARIADIAVKKCRKSRDPKDIEPGTYEVILEPAATAEIFSWLKFVAFGSESFEDGTSFIAGRLGEKVMGDNVSIYDDALDPECSGLPFDYEGVPKKRVHFIKSGVAKGVVHNRISAARTGGESTGHSLPAESAVRGAEPLNLHLGAGDESSEDMISEVENGLLVTRFHYINGFLDPRNALMTGMTRDGLFRIKDGRLKHGVKNLRFTDSMLDVFSNILSISEERQSFPEKWVGLSVMRIPTLRVGKFKFTGKTDF